MGRLCEDSALPCTPGEQATVRVTTLSQAKIRSFELFGWDEERKWPIVGALEFSALNLLDRQLGHTQSRKILEVFGKCVAEVERKEYVRCYHRYDEVFMFRFREAAKVDGFIRDLSELLDSLIIEIETADTAYHFKGVQTRFGTGSDFEAAYQAMIGKTQG